MAGVLSQLRRRILSPSEQHTKIIKLLSLHASSMSHERQSSSPEAMEEKSNWMELPPFRPSINANALARNISGESGGGKSEESMNALKWVRRCCPQLPMSLVQKLFRLRQVRKSLASTDLSGADSNVEQTRLRRVSAKDNLLPGEILILPLNLHNKKSSFKQYECSNNEDEMKFIQGFELYKDAEIIVLNKPHGIPVQGGVGIECSMDSLASRYLKYDYNESPRLVHRLDRDSSGVLVLGRNKTSASVLHSIFREKTFNALSDDIKNAPKILQRKYIALVIGVPRKSKGLISARLAKIAIEDGKSERITVVDNIKSSSAQHALTEYKVIESFSNGYTWLELCPLTGRKHQLRVHCAEILKTPIVGDYKYGWLAHRKWKPIVPFPPDLINFEKIPGKNIPFGLDLLGGGVSEKRPYLHLHCKQMILPDISSALQLLQNLDVSDCDFSNLKKLSFVAPLPFHMQLSWDILRSLP